MIHVLSGAETVRHFLDIAAFDRGAWADSKDAQFVPDGEHSWRVWCEYSFVAAAFDESGSVAGILCAFDTSEPGLHFLHKLAVRANSRRARIGSRLIESYCTYLDTRAMTSLFTTSPENTAMNKLGEVNGFALSQFVEGYYRPEEDRNVRMRSAVAPYKPQNEF